MTALDHNYNLNRPQAVTRDGKVRHKIECNRAGGKFIVREVKVPKDNSWRDKVANFVLEVIWHLLLQYCKDFYSPSMLELYPTLNFQLV